MKRETYEVKLWLKGNSQPIAYAALAAYETMAFYCIVYIDKSGTKRVRKFPLGDILWIDAEYKYITYVPTAQRA